MKLLIGGATEAVPGQKYVSLAVYLPDVRFDSWPPPIKLCRQCHRLMKMSQQIGRPFQWSLYLVKSYLVVATNGSTTSNRFNNSW